ncbi:hypothetical protein NUACC26_052750 [Scytonema sp. NUACC26]
MTSCLASNEYVREDRLRGIQAPQRSSGVLEPRCDEDDDQTLQLRPDVRVLARRRTLAMGDTPVVPREPDLRQA